MHKNRLLSIGFVALLMLNVIMLALPLAPVTATPSGTYGSIWVEPDYVNGSLVGYGNTFVVDVKINISETSPDYPDNPGIFAFAYYFTWNDTLLELISKATYVPSNGVWESGSSVVANTLLDTDTNTVDDTHSYSATAFGVPTAFTGVMTLAEYTLNVTYQPMGSDASCLLDISDKGFIFSDEEEYPLDVYDGLYEIKAQLQVMSELYVDPQSIFNALLEPCENFTVKIEIVDATDLSKFDFKLSFENTILEATEAEEGPFLGSFGTTLVNNLEINNAEGYVWMSVSLVTGGPAIGEGTIANVTFHVIDVGESVLGLFDTHLSNPTNASIPHETFDGYFNNVLMAGIFVDPPSIIDPMLLPPSTFTINISIGNITNMYDYVFKLGYNTEILNCLSVEIIPFNDETHFTSIVSVDDPAGVIYVNVTYFNPATPITTIPSLAFATIRFQVTGLGSSIFDLYDTHLSDPTGAEIPHKTFDGILVIIIRDVAISSVKPSTTATYVGWFVNISVVAANEGDIAESFTVSAYYDDNLIGTQMVTDLPSGENETLIFTWNTAGMQPCNNYTIKAEASVVPYETDTADNEYIDGEVKIKIMGDINGDGKVDLSDIRTIARAYLSAAVDDPETPYDETENWNPSVDLNIDDHISIFDIRLGARNYGESC